MSDVLIYPFEPGYRTVSGSDLNRMIETLNKAFSQTVSGSQIGQANGIASLDANGKVPTGELPSLGGDPTAKVGTAAVNGTAQTYMRSDASPPIDLAIAPTWTGIHTFSQATRLDGGVSSLLGVATVGAGVASEFAWVNSSIGLNADQASATLFAVPASKGGTYRASVYAVVITPDGASSTLPSVGIGWTDADTSVALLANNVSSTNPANAAGAFGQGVQIINAKGGTNITWQTSSYASGTAGAMKYAVRIRLEYLG